MIAEIIAIGTELVSGQKLDTNSQWLSQRLGDLGIATHFHAGVGDDMAENVAAFEIALQRADLVLVTGGIGPTQDDLTRDVLAKVAGVGLVEDADSLAAIEGFFARRNRAMTPRNRVQAMRPEGSEPMSNPIGTAPGIWMKVESTWFACLPGVPSEMREMFTDQVIPRLRRENLVDRVIVHRVINMFGLGESEIEARAMDLTARGRIPEVGITASDATISFRISAEGPDEVAARLAAEPTARTIYERFGDVIIGEGSDDVAEALVTRLRQTGSTIAVAESCTGGLVADRISRIPGVSDVFLGGVVSYANTAKTSLLGVEPSLIDEFGAVSAEVADAMARGVRDRLGASVGIAVTGIAGPSGGSSEKPVGLVYIGVATCDGAWTKKLELGPEQPRTVIRSRSAKHAINLARLKLVKG